MLSLYVPKYHSLVPCVSKGRLKYDTRSPSSGLILGGAMLTLASLLGATVFAEDLGLHPEQPRQGTIAATVLSSGPLPQDACRGQWLWLSHLSRGEAAGVIILGGGTRYRSLSCCPWLSVPSEG